MKTRTTTHSIFGLHRNISWTYTLPCSTCACWSRRMQVPKRLGAFPTKLNCTALHQVPDVSDCLLFRPDHFVSDSMKSMREGLYKCVTASITRVRSRVRRLWSAPDLGPSVCDPPIVLTFPQFQAIKLYTRGASTMQRVRTKLLRADSRKS